MDKINVKQNNISDKDAMEIKKNKGNVKVIVIAIIAAKSPIPIFFISLYRNKTVPTESREFNILRENNPNGNNSRKMLETIVYMGLALGFKKTNGLYKAVLA